MKNTPLIQNKLIQNQLTQTSLNQTSLNQTSVNQAPITNPVVLQPGSPAVNTATTVRVNNLGNLESVTFNIAIAMAVLLPALGGLIVCRAYQDKSARAFGKIRRYLLGSGLIAFGLSAPAILNWLIASARDAGCGDMF